MFVRRRGYVWIEGNEISCLFYGIRCFIGVKVVILNNRIYDCSILGIFFRERFIGLVVGNYIYINKEVGVDIRSGSDLIV